MPYYSVIVFSRRCTLKEMFVTDPTVRVINRDAINYAIDSLILTSPINLSQQEIDRLYNTLYPFTQTSEATKAAHIANIQHKTYEAKSKTNFLFICPKCGGNLVLRTATRGTNAGKQFYGCSNFPKCKYIKNL